MRMVPKVGDTIQGDEWQGDFHRLEADSGFKDSSYKGCQFRYRTRDNYFIGCNIKVTGEPHDIGRGRYKSRCQIVIVGDGEPDHSFRGWIFHNKE